MRQRSTELNFVDVHVGHRVRLRRQALSYSQERLASAMAVSFQQIQKYERGANRISASRLFELSTTLDVPVSYFFEGLIRPSSSGAEFAQPIHDGAVVALLSEPDGVRLAKAYMRIRRPVKKNLADLAQELARRAPGATEEDPGDPEDGL